MSITKQGDFDCLCLKNGINLYIHTTKSFKSTTVDILVQELLQKKRNTRVALIGRLLERGTSRWPDMKSLNRCIDEMYGASFAVDVDQLGDRQLIHLSFEVVDERFIPHREDLLKRGIDFLHEVLHHPAREGKGFRSDYLQQEKKALRLNLDSLFNDKMAYAQRRCIEAMCSDEPYALSAYGDPRDFRGIHAENLLKCHYQLLARNPIDVFITGRADPGRLARLCEGLFDGERNPMPFPRQVLPVDSPGECREIFEHQDVNQGKLVLGYRTRINILDEEYPTLVLFNALFGGDGHSRLFKYVREEAGLCYFISSYLEPICGLMFVDASIEREDYQEVRQRIGEQMDAIREKVGEDELALVRILLTRRLEALQDSRAGLVRFCYQQSMMGLKGSRREFQERLESVTCEDISSVAQKVELDTAFFLHGEKDRQSR